MTMDRWSKRLVRWAHRPGFRSPGAPGTRKWGRERWYKLVAVCTTAALLNLGLATQNVLDAAELTKQNRGQLRQFYGSVAAADERAEQQGTAAPPEDPLAALGLGGGDPFGGLGASDPFGLGLDASIPGMPKLPALPADPTSSAIPGMPSIPGLFGASGPQGPAGIKPPSAPAAAQQPETEETERVPLGVSLDRLSSQLRKLRTVSGAARTAPETYASTWKSVQSIDQDAERASTKLRANGARANRIGGAIATRQKALEERFDAARQKLHGQVESFQKALETQRFEEANGIGQEIDTTLRSLKLQAGPTRGKSPLPHFAPKIEERSIPAGVAKSSGGRAPAKCLDCGEPTQADRDTTPETDATSEIAALAASLDRDPARIYHWVLNNVDFVPTWGSIQGAGATLASRRGNAVDQASLLISLLRASGIPCRYVHGSVNIPGPQLASWLGTTDVSFAVEQLSRNGVASQLHYAGGTVGSVDLEHAWVRAWVRYAPHRGIDKGVGDRWVDIDPSFKAVSVHRQRDVTTEIGVDPVNFLRQIKAQSTINASESWVKDVPEQLIINRIDDWGTAVDRYAEANGFTNATLYGSRAIQQKDLQILPLELPYTVLSEIESQPEVDDALKTSLSLKLSDANGTVLLERELELCSMAGKRLTLRFEPSTGADQSVIDAYRNEEAFPVYLVDVKPALKLEGAVVGDEYGTPVGMGQPLSLEMVLDGPLFDEERFTSSVTAGAYSALVFDLQGTSQRQLEERIGELRLAKEKLQAGTPGDMDTYLGEALHCIGLSYWRQLDGLDELAGGGLGLEVTRQVSQLITSYSLNVTELFGLPFEAAGGPVTLSVDRDAIIPLSITGDENKEIQYHAISALTSSVLEHSMLEQALGGQGISTIRLLQEANKAGAKTYTFTTANATAIDAALTALPSALVQDVKDAVNAGRTVTVPNQESSFAGHEGTGWIAFDPQTGAAGLFVDGDLAGGVRAMTTLKAADVLSPTTASTYVPLVTPGIEWIELASSIIERSGFRYVPAVAAIGQWFANAIDLDDASFLAAGIALSGPLSLIASRPHIGKVVVTPELFSPNEDTVKDTATISALLSRESEWLVEVRNANQEVTKHWEGTGKVIDLTWMGLDDADQPADDGRYTVRFTATAVGLETPAIPEERLLTLDKTDPTAAFLMPGEDDEVRGNVSLIGTADDNNLDTYMLEYGAGENPTSWTAITADSTEVVIDNRLGVFQGYRNANGEYTFRLRVSDKAGNDASATRHLVLNDPDNDIEAPEVELQVPGDEDDVSGEMTIRAHATDNGTLARVTLSVDGETVEEWTEVQQDDLYETTLDTVTLRNGAHVVSVVAVDARSNQRQDSADVTTQNAISELMVEPNPFTPNGDGWQDATSISATLDPPGAWTLEVRNEAEEVVREWTGSGASVLRSWDGTTQDGPAPSGTYHASLSAGPESATTMLELMREGISPIVEILSPPDGQVAVTPTGVTVTVVDATLTSWKLELQRDTEVTLLAQGSASVMERQVATVDPPTIANGKYELVLTATSPSESVEIRQVLHVDSQTKIGNISFSELDFSHLVGDVPFRIHRSYNSFDSSVVGEFGRGWSLAMLDVDLDDQTGRVTAVTDFGEGVEVQARSGYGRDVSVTVPGIGKATFVFEPVGPLPEDPLTFRAAWRSRSFVPFTLRPMGSPYISMLPNHPVWSGGTYDEGMDFYEVPGYELVSNAGWIYRIEKPVLHGPTTILAEGFSRDVTAILGEPVLTTIIDPNGNVIEVSPEGITDTQGHGLIVERNERGLVTRVGDESGRHVEYDYSGDFLESFRSADGELTTFDYDESGRLTAVHAPGESGPVMLLYDAAGRLIGMRDADGHDVSFQLDPTGRQRVITDRAGRSHVEQLDEHGRVVTTTDALGHTHRFGYDEAGRTTRNEDALGNATTTEFDDSGRKLSTTDAAGNTTRFSYFEGGATRTDPEGTVWTYLVDAKGRLTRATDPLGNGVTYSYDSAGNAIQITDPLGNSRTASFLSSSTIEVVGSDERTSTVEFTPSGAVSVVTHEWEGGPWEESFTYTPDGRRERHTRADGSEERTTYAPDGLTAEATDGLGRITRYTRNADGLVTNVERPDGLATSSEYDEAGNLVRRTQPSGHVIEYTLDAAGRVVLEEHNDGTSERRTYDAADRVVEVRDGRGFVRSAQYDDVGRVVAKVDPAGATTTIEYGANGQISAVTDALGRSARTEYDAARQPVRYVGRDGTITTVAYDAAGNVAAATDELGNTTSYTYNVDGQITSVTDPLDHVTHYERDSRGFLTARVDANGHRLEYHRDAMGRETGRLLPGTAQWTEREYDGEGRLLRSVSAAGIETVNAYNGPGGRLSRSDVTGGGWVTFQYDPSTGLLDSVTNPEGTVEYEYDASGRCNGHVEPDGTHVQYQFDANANVVALLVGNRTWRYTYDSCNRLASTQDPFGRETRYTRDLVGRVTEVQWPGGVRSLVAYTLMDRVAMLEHREADGDVIARYEYEYDAAGRQTVVRALSGAERHFEYDAAGRLVRERVVPEAGPPEERTITYDDVGNRTSLVDFDETVTSWTYDAADRLTNSGTTTYEYDVDGRLTHAVNGSDETTYVHDGFGQLVSVTNGSWSLTLAYDGTGALTRRVAGGTTRFTYDRRHSAVQVIGENCSGASPVYYWRGEGRIARETPEDFELVLHDAQESLRLVLDEAGQVVSQFDYDAFGTPTTSISTGFGFRDEWFEADAGLYFLRSRHYSPAIGRFIRMDDWDGVLERPSSTHEYLYCDGDPVNYADPLGYGNLIETLTTAAELGYLSLRVWIVSGKAAATAFIIIDIFSPPGSLPIPSFGAASYIDDGVQAAKTALSANGRKIIHEVPRPNAAGIDWITEYIDDAGRVVWEVWEQKSTVLPRVKGLLGEATDYVGRPVQQMSEAWIEKHLIELAIENPSKWEPVLKAFSEGGVPARLIRSRAFLEEGRLLVTAYDVLSEATVPGKVSKVIGMIAEEFVGLDIRIIPPP